MSADVALMTARLAGLRAEVEALEDQLSRATPAASVPTTPGGDVQTMPRTDAIVTVLLKAGRPLHIKEVVAALAAAGRRNVNDDYGNVSATIQMMLGSRVRRTSRGYYEAM